MLVGYVEVNSAGQSLENQLQTLSDAGCAKVFSEEQNWMSVGARNALQRALDFVREGDTLVVTRIDHLTRFANDAQDMIACLRSRDVEFRCLDPICSEGAYLAIPDRQFPAEGKAVHCLTS
jgi:DNA invertase Pin-like site-specific DNA recombinase